MREHSSLFINSCAAAQLVSLHISTGHILKTGSELGQMLVISLHWPR